MQSITYVARRSLVGWHTAETAYTLDLSLRVKDREVESSSSAAVSLGGRVVTTFQSISVFWRCDTGWLTLAQAQEFREFLDSAADGQYMQFDPENGAGGVSVPSTARTVVLYGKKYSEQRLQTGATQAEHRFSFTFVLRET